MKITKELMAYIAWLCLYILCAGLGVMAPYAEGPGKVFMVLTALIFYIPGIYLLVTAIGENNRKMLLRLRLVSVISLALTLVALVAMFASLSETAYEILAVVSAPMQCGQYWALSLFCWAALMMATIPGVIISRKKK